jgi:hypothetical protein
LKTYRWRFFVQRRPLPFQANLVTVEFDVHATKRLLAKQHFPFCMKKVDDEEEEEK